MYLASLSGTPFAGPEVLGGVDRAGNEGVVAAGSATAGTGFMGLVAISRSPGTLGTQTCSLTVPANSVFSIVVISTVI